MRTCKLCGGPITLANAKADACEDCVAKIFAMQAATWQFLPEQRERRPAERGSRCATCFAEMQEESFTMEDGNARCPLCQVVAAKIIFNREPTNLEEAAALPAQVANFYRWQEEGGPKTLSDLPDGTPLCPNCGGPFLKKDSDRFDVCGYCILGRQSARHGAAGKSFSLDNRIAAQAAHDRALQILMNRMKDSSKPVTVADIVHALSDADSDPARLRDPDWRRGVISDYLTRLGSEGEQHRLLAVQIADAVTTIFIEAQILQVQKYVDGLSRETRRPNPTEMAAIATTIKVGYETGAPIAWMEAVAAASGMRSSAEGQAHENSHQQKSRVLTNRDRTSGDIAKSKSGCCVIFAIGVGIILAATAYEAATHFASEKSSERSLNESDADGMANF